MKKRFLASFLAILMLLSLLPMSAFAAGTTYAISNGTPQSDAEKNHGYITIDKENAAEGDTVTVTVKPADGYKLKSLTAVPATPTFKAVYNTTDSKNTLTFYYDAVDHSGDNITVYEDGTANFLFDNSESKAAKWGYNSIRSNVKSVVIDSSVANYKGLTSTTYMFDSMNNAGNISGAEYLDVSNVTDMSYMFRKYGYESAVLNTVPNVGGWNTGNVTNMTYMFYCYGNKSTVLNAVPNVSGWQTGNVTDLSSMFNFYGYKSTELNAVPDVSGWSTDNVTTMSYMFQYYGYNSTVLNFTLDLSTWSVAKVTSYSSMFNNAGAKADTWSVTIPAKTGEQANDATHWYVGAGTNTGKYIMPADDRTFTPDTRTFKAVYDTTDSKNTLTFYYDAVDHSGDNITVYEDGTTNFLFDDNKSNGAKWGYEGIRKNVKSVVIDESVKNYTGLTSTAYMFSNMSYAESISGAEYLDVANVTDMSNMFYSYGYNSTGLTAVPNVSKWQTGKVTNLSKMFYQYGYKSTVLNAVPDVSKWNTGSVTDLSRMFYQYGYKSTGLTAVPDVSKWQTGNVTDMSYLFCYYGYTSTELNTVPDVSGWNTGNVSDMSNIFISYGKSSTVLTAVPDVSGWNTGNAINLSSLFNNYGNSSKVLNFTLDLSKWNVAKVTSVSSMFLNAGSNAPTWSVTIPAKTGEQANDATHWYVGNGTSTTKSIVPATGRTFTLAAATISKVEDLLETVEGDFPTTSETAWTALKNEFTGICYIKGENLYFYSVKPFINLPLTTDVSGSGNSFTCSYSGATFTFNMTEGKLTSIVVENSFGLDGEYKPASKPEVEFVLQTDGTYQFKMPAYPVVIKAEFEKAPAHTHGTGTEAVTFEKEVKTFADLQDLFTNGGSGYMANDIECTAGLTVAANVNLCLNDKVLNLAGKGNITVPEGKTFNLYDCGTTVRYYDKDGSTGLWTLNVAKTSGDHTTKGGVITGGNAAYGGGVYAINGTFNLYGGSITGNKASSGGGGVYNNGTFTMSGGSITGNKASTGGGVYNYGTFTVSGGSITGNEASTGGGVYNYDTFTMNGGSITGNEASYGGGGVYNHDTFTMNDGSITGNEANSGGGVINYVTFTMSGGSISENTARDYGGGVDNYNSFVMTGGEIAGNITKGAECLGGGVDNYGAMTVGGSAKITGNTDKTGMANNLYLYQGGDKTLTISETVAADGMSIGVTTETTPAAGTPVQITTNGASTDTSYFTSDNDTYEVKFNTDHLELALKAVPHVHSFTYTATGGKITATCTDGCDKGYDTKPLTLTLTKNSAEGYYVYSNAAKTIKFANGEADAWKAAVGSNAPKITYTAKEGSALTSGYALNAGSYTASVTVNEKTASIDFTIDKATPYIKSTPEPTDIAYGKKLADSTLSGGYVQVSSTNSTQIAGLFTWTNPDTVPGINDSEVTEYDVTFTPTDTNNYNTVSCKVKIKVNHTHTPVLVNGQAATEEAAGWNNYYECDCGDFFEDATGLIPITDLNAWKAAGGNGYIAPLVHSITPVNGQDATDTEAGFKAYYECKSCGKYYEDATGLVVITDLNAWKAEDGNGYLAPTLIVVDSLDETVEQGPETYEIKEDGIHVYSDDIIFKGKTNRKFIIKSEWQSLNLSDIIVENDLIIDGLSDNVTLNLTNAEIKGNVIADNSNGEMYLCAFIDGENIIGGNVESDGSFTVYGNPDASLSLKSIKTETMLYVIGLRIENMKENYELGETKTATPDDVTKPIKLTVKKNAGFPDEEEFVINSGKPFKFGEKLNIQPPVVCDENGAPFDPQPELTVVYYRYDDDNEYSYSIVDGVPTEEGKYKVAFFMPEDDLNYTGGGSYDFTIGHNIQIVEGKAATTKETGYKAYYECKGCNKYYEDASGLVEITDLAKWKAEGGNGYIAKLEEEPKSPLTGDTSNMSLWVMFLALSSMGLCACLVLGKKRKNEQ